MGGTIELRYALRFFEHVVSVMGAYFEVPHDLEYLREINDHKTARRFIRALFLPASTPAELTHEQQYLQSLLELPGSAIEAGRATNRLRASKPRSRTPRASTALLVAARDLAYEAYHFQERVKEHINSVLRIHLSDVDAEKHKKKLIRMLKAYQTSNDRLLRYRNFLVHGPKNRVDEFIELKLAELGAETLHEDLWVEHRRVFDEYQQEWCDMARTLLRSMEALLAMVQSENENAIAAARLTFTVVHARCSASAC